MGARRLWQRGGWRRSTGKEGKLRSSFKAMFRLQFMISFFFRILIK